MWTVVCWVMTPRSHVVINNVLEKLLSLSSPLPEYRLTGSSENLATAWYS